MAGDRDDRAVPVLALSGVATHPPVKGVPRARNSRDDQIPVSAPPTLSGTSRTSSATRHSGISGKTSARLSRIRFRQPAAPAMWLTARPANGTRLA